MRIAHNYLGICREYRLDWMRNPIFDSFIDIGGCFGDFSSAMLEISPECEIVIYEPFLDAYLYIMERFMYTNKVKVIHEAFGDGSPLYLKKFKDWEKNVFVKENTGEECVTSRSLKDIVSRNRINLNKRCGLKMDCEGGEWDLIKDLESETLLKLFDYIGIEIHFQPKKGNNTQFSHLHPYKCVVEWIQDVFDKTHHISHGSSSGKMGHKTYILTKKQERYRETL